MDKVKLSFDEIKSLQTDILIATVDFCEKHNLKYFLAYGTLLGAIRHKGYIPWDDDIDIVMPRQDYNTFIETFNKENKGTHYLAIPPFKGNHTILKVADTRTFIQSVVYKDMRKKGCYRTIDIFPLDGVPEDYEKYKEWYQKLHEIYYGFYRKQQAFSGGIKSRIKLLITKLRNHAYLPKSSFRKQSKKLHSQYSYENCQYIGAIESTANSIKNKVKKEWYDEYILVDFEGHKLRAPKNYHEILSSLYGDYMECPPVEQQVFLHLEDVFWR